MSNWIYNNKPFTQDDVKKYEGFVYVIIDKTDPDKIRKYLGKKFFWEIRKVKGKRNRQRSVSNWQDYWSSSEKVKKLVELHGKDKFERHI